MSKRGDVPREEKRNKHYYGRNEKSGHGKNILTRKAKRHEHLLGLLLQNLISLSVPD